jgi:cell division protein ZipA
MDGLRWLLLIFGILVIAGVYFYSRRERKENGESVTQIERVEPTLDQSDVALDADTVADASEPAAMADEDQLAIPNNDQPQKIVTLRLVARSKQSFKGDELVLSLRGIGLRHGQFGIFHRYDGNDEKRTIFSAASLVEPGSFDLANIKDQEIPGISLFLVLPGPIDGVEAFDLMMESARALSQSLNGDLLDESGSNLSIQRERYLREEVIQYQHQNSNLVA